ncbi:hypothetical protein CCO02nite_26780 [Cellulomonas composti]|uniref:Uncharacterized protein n=1 Tax=Cellulomonas composti TaxID=266130 RepID=A0A511JDE8_9CELL|nr:hypothetical protein CCO02nite_26780 [Cellulomonas composti]
MRELDDRGLTLRRPQERGDGLRCAREGARECIDVALGHVTAQDRGAHVRQRRQGLRGPHLLLRPPPRRSERPGALVEELAFVAEALRSLTLRDEQRRTQSDDERGQPIEHRKSPSPRTHGPRVRPVDRTDEPDQLVRDGREPAECAPLLVERNGGRSEIPPRTLVDDA